MQLTKPQRDEEWVHTPQLGEKGWRWGEGGRSNEIRNILYNLYIYFKNFRELANLEIMRVTF